MSELSVREGLWKQTPSGVVLVGARCHACGQMHFPAAKLCLSCLADEFDEAPLPTQGVLFSFTTVHMPSAHFSAPYTVGYVVLDAVKVFAPLLAAQGTLRVGMAMRLDFGPLWEEDGRPVTGYRFVPS